MWVFFDICVSCHTVPCSLVVTCLERADLLALLCVMFSRVVFTFPYGVQVQVWYLIVWISELCLLHYFYEPVLYVFIHLCIVMVQ